MDKIGKGDSPGAGMSVDQAISRFGYTAKAVRAWCAARGLRYTPQGAPAEWYVAWRSRVARDAPGYSRIIEDDEAVVTRTQISRGAEGD